MFMKHLRQKKEAIAKKRINTSVGSDRRGLNFIGDTQSEYLICQKSFDNKITDFVNIYITGFNGLIICIILVSYLLLF